MLGEKKKKDSEYSTSSDDETESTWCFRLRLYMVSILMFGLKLKKLTVGLGLFDG